MRIFCTSCGKEFTDEANFCPQCGSMRPQVERCPACNQLLPNRTATLSTAQRNTPQNFATSTVTYEVRYGSNFSLDKDCENCGKPEAKDNCPACNGGI